MTTQDVLEIKATMRDGPFGTGSARAIRRAGRIPAVAYGNRENFAFSICANDFKKKRRAASLKSGSLLTHLIQLDIENGQKRYAIVKRMQRHVVKGEVTHVDFLLVDINQKTKVEVPVVLLNEHSCPGVKKGGVINLLHNTLTVECIPTDIPEHIEIDLSHLTIGHSIHVSDLSLPSGIAVVMREENPPVLTVSSPSSEDPSSDNADDEEDLHDSDSNNKD
mgnify:CR=1 FL=1